MGLQSMSHQPTNSTFGNDPFMNEFLREELKFSNGNPTIVPHFKVPYPPVFTVQPNEQSPYQHGNNQNQIGHYHQQLNIFKVPYPPVTTMQHDQQVSFQHSVDQNQIQNYNQQLNTNQIYPNTLSTTNNPTAAFPNVQNYYRSLNDGSRLPSTTEVPMIPTVISTTCESIQ